MNAYAALVACWNDNRAITHRSKSFQLLASGQITSRQYAAILRQVYHNVRQNSQLMALAASRFRGDQRKVLKQLLRHSVSESGHEDLALNDIRSLGEDVTGIPSERPLPASFALSASIAQFIEHHDPVAIVGFMFQLEYTPVQLGQQYMAALAKAGIPRSAMSFIEEHAAVDVSHCKLIEKYCTVLIRTPEQLETVLYVQRLTAELYANMLDQAIASAGCWQNPCAFLPQDSVEQAAAA